MRSVQNAECGKFQFQFSISISGEMQRNSVLTIKNNNNDKRNNNNNKTLFLTAVY